MLSINFHYSFLIKKGKYYNLFQVKLQYCLYGNVIAFGKNELLEIEMELI